MTALLIFSFLVGAVLGQRFRVLVLLPVTFALLLTVLPVSLMTSLGALEGLKATVFAAIALQAGYLFGSAARFSLAAARAARVFGRPVKASR
ncbi:MULTISPECIES: hypothetical protein [Bradyrhizobium]|uniref:Uncharacterized protein n=1 Tax=Bradyrhizobium frederickii TaxID=2560054 RepID=A0A4Y9L3G4_9BRAD|nr:MULTISPECIES: hypothetical protein [Bradyrhizobium]RTE90038.1 hypothetical protein D6B98_26430 [Bradyrhizobium sp. LVM 105]TFV36372.1 hypothetical protein E4K66_24050 [Bradyrhizobium frederickii]